MPYTFVKRFNTARYLGIFSTWLAYTQNSFIFLEPSLAPNTGRRV